ncbi:hypothetical protein DBR11_12445, partial [Pedobacter sp. HMWF019]|uniref:TlpA family protein disulfide reductase n=1 Tax=Pedobacter sp. HMWF019 TaxID=2056856 RepID=UPI000D4B0EEA
LSYAQQKKTPKHETRIYINVYFKEAKPNDTLYLCLDNLLFTVLEKYKKVYSATLNDQGYFRFEASVKEEHGYFTILKRRTFSHKRSKNLISITCPYFWEKRDSISIKLSYIETEAGLYSTTKFYGHGAQKYNLFNEIDSLKLSPNHITQIQTYPIGFDGNILKYETLDKISDAIQARLSYLQTNRKNLSLLSYNVFKANIVYSVQSGLLQTISSFGRDSLVYRDKEFQAKFKHRLKSSFDTSNNYGIDLKGLSNSVQFLRFLYKKTRAMSFVNTGHFSIDTACKEIINYYQKKPRYFDIRDLIVMMHCLTTERESDNIFDFYSNIKTVIKNPEYLDILKNLELRAPGRHLRKYFLEDDKGKLRSIEEFKNKVVLIDFWFKGCGGCSSFYKNTLSKVEKSFQNNSDVVFLSICGDADKTLWKNTIHQGDYTSNEAVNLYTNGMGYKHPIVVENQIWAFPCVILLDQTGKIVFFNTSNLYNHNALFK